MTGSDAELGKPQGSDERHGKLTYVSLFGLEGAASLRPSPTERPAARSTRSKGNTRDLELITDFIHTRHA